MLEQVRQHVAWIGEWPPERERPRGFGDEDWDAYLDETEQMLRSAAGGSITVADEGTEHGGILLSMGDLVGIVIPAQYVVVVQPGGYEHFLFARTGEDWAVALEAVEELARRLDVLVDARDRDDHSEVDGPDDLHLQGRISLRTAAQGMTLLEVQRAIASQTDMSIISDFFTARTGAFGEDFPSDTPLSRILNHLAEWNVEWETAGDCIVFHHTHWHSLAQREIPESLIERWRGKLSEQGRFTLEDVVNIAVEIENRPTPPRPHRFSMPEDLLEAGAGAAAGPARGMLLLYHALTPEERAAAGTPEGLRLSDLPPPKQREIADYVLTPGVPRRILGMPVSEFVAGTVFFIEAEPGDGRPVGASHCQFRLQPPRRLGLSAARWPLTVRVSAP
jgi:hypothetical protein